mgnify:CR=1 FL=1
MTPSMLSSGMPKESRQMRLSVSISSGEATPSATIILNRRSSSAVSTGSPATLRTPGSPSKRDLTCSMNVSAI